MRISDHGRWRGHHSGDASPGQGKGLLVDRGWLYDVETWFTDVFLVGGKLGALQWQVLDLAQLGEGRSLLDLGCGTGTLALKAARRVGPRGRIAGIDPASKPIARARAKARRARAVIDFQVGSIDDLVFPDSTFDAVTSTLMLHHLPDDVKEAGFAEVARVLKPGGRVVVADFTGDPSATPGRGRRHAVHAGIDAVAEPIGRAGLVWNGFERLSLGRVHHGFNGVAVGYAETTATSPTASSNAGDENGGSSRPRS